MLPAGMTLFHGATSCSSVTRRALDRAGADFKIVTLDLAEGEQRGADYLAINPKGRVPALRFGETILTENPAILDFIDRSAPTAGLLPGHNDPATWAQVLAELLWCSATLHPAVRNLRAPAKFTTGDVEPVKARALETLAELARYAETKLIQDHWIGDAWSILDTYVAWGFAAASVGGFSTAPYPRITQLIEKEHPFER